MRFVPKFIRHAINKCYTNVLINLSGLFDANWYKHTYFDDVQSSGMSPLYHFLKIGYKKGYNPSVKFSCAKYIAAYPIAKGVNPLIHYLKEGRFHGYKCYGIYDEERERQELSEEPEQIKAPKCIKDSPFFNKKYYKTQLGRYQEIQSLADHYYTIGWKQGLNPSTFFDGNSYLTLNTDLIPASICPLYHYEFQDEHRQYASVSESDTNSVKHSDIEHIKKRREKQKVALLVSHELSLTGAPRALFSLAQSLRRCGIYPVIVSPKNGELRKEIEKSGIECKIVLDMISTSPRLNSLRIPFSEYVKEFDFILLNTLVLVPLIESLAKFSKKSMCWIHESEMGNNFTFYGLLPHYLSIFNQVYVVGDYANSILRQRTDNKIETSVLLYSTEDTPICLPKSDEEAKIRIAIVGTIYHLKGHDILVDSIKFIPIDVRKKIEILIIGEPSDKEITKKINSCNDVNFRMMGMVEHHELLKIMASIDILVCPSRDDSMPIVCTEAMMLSKPVIVSTHTGTASFIHDGINGFVFDSGNSKQLADSIVKAVNNSHLLPDMGKRARKIYEEYFTLEQIDKNVKQIFA